MQKTIYLSIFILTALLFTQCSKDICKSDPCGPNGTCVSAGSTYYCECDAGFMGEHCEEAIPVPQYANRNEFTGEYNSTTTCSGAGTNNYEITLENHEQRDIKIHNIYNVGFYTYAEARTNGTFEIPEQPLGNQSTIKGAVKKENGDVVIDWIFVGNPLQGNTISDTCRAVLLPK